MAFELYIKVKEFGPTPAALKRNLGWILKRAWTATGIEWHTKFRLKHFTHQGAQEYGYTPRKGEEFAWFSKEWWNSYTGKKWRKYKHNLPLVFTGESMGRTEILDVRATRNGCKVILNAPGLNRRPLGGRIDMRDEMTRISPAEEKYLIDYFNNELVEGIKHIVGENVTFSDQDDGTIGVFEAAA